MDQTIRSKNNLMSEKLIKVSGNILSKSLRETNLEFKESLIKDF